MKRKECAEIELCCCVAVCSLHTPAENGVMVTVGPQTKDHSFALFGKSAVLLGKPPTNTSEIPIKHTHPAHCKVLASAHGLLLAVKS